MAACISMWVMMLFTLMCVLSDNLDSYVYQTVSHDDVHYDVCFVR